MIDRIREWWWRRKVTKLVSRYQYHEQERDEWENRYVAETSKEEEKRYRNINKHEAKKIDIVKHLLIIGIWRGVWIQLDEHRYFLILEDEDRLVLWSKDKED